MAMETVFYQYMKLFIGKFFDHQYILFGLTILSMFNSWQLAKYLFIRNRYNLLKFIVGAIICILILLSIAVIDNIGDLTMFRRP